MRDFETSIENLRNATGNGAEHFCFYLEDPVPINRSYFYWYSSQSDLHEALVEDLWSLLFENAEVEEIEIFVGEIQKIVDDLKPKKSPIFHEMTKRIQDVWSEFDNSSNLYFSYTGTYEMLCKGNSEFERKIRNVFRYGKEESMEHKGQAIADHELDDFNEFISSKI